MGRRRRVHPPHPSTCHSYQIKLVALVTSSLGRIWDCWLGRGKNWGGWRVRELEIKKGRDFGKMEAGTRTRHLFEVLQYQANSMIGGKQAAI